MRAARRIVPVSAGARDLGSEGHPWNLRAFPTQWLDPPQRPPTPRHGLAVWQAKKVEREPRCTTGRAGVTGHLRLPGSWGEIDEVFVGVWRSAECVPGWLSTGQARALSRAASCVPGGQWLMEIGSHHGRSTVFLASAKSPEVRMLAVDPFDNPRWGGGLESLATFERTLDSFGLTGDVQTFRGVSSETSARWHGEPIGPLFADGAHDRASVLADIDGWQRFVAPGGLVFFHAAFSSIGVTRALTERFLVNPQYRYLGAERTLVGFARRETTGMRMLADTARMAARYPYFAPNAAIKLSVRRDWALPTRLLRYRPGDDLF